MVETGVDEFLAKTRPGEDELIAILDAQDGVVADRWDNITPKLRAAISSTNACERHVADVGTVVWGVDIFRIDAKSVEERNVDTGNGTIALCALLNADRHPYERYRFAFPMKGERFRLGWGIATLDEILEHGKRGFCCVYCKERFKADIDSEAYCPQLGSGRNPYLLHSLKAYRPIEQLWIPARAEKERDRRRIEFAKPLSSESLRRIV